METNYDLSLIGLKLAKYVDEGSDVPLIYRVMLSIAWLFFYLALFKYMFME